MFRSGVRYLKKKLGAALGTYYLKGLLWTRGFSIPKGLRIDGLIYWNVSKHGTVRIGHNFSLNSRRASNLLGITQQAAFQVFGKGMIIIGHNCGFTSSVISSRSSVKIGDHVMMGANVRLLDHDFHSLNYVNRRNNKLDEDDVKSEPIVIGNDVFIGVDSIILKGVHIGDRSIIGAGSVIAIKTIPPDSIVVGNPAKIIGKTKGN